MLSKYRSAKEIMQNKHISKVIALFVSTTVWQSGGIAPYCKTAIAACWALPKLPSGRWAARFPLLHLFPPLPLLVLLTPATCLFPLFTLLSNPVRLLFCTCAVCAPPSGPGSHAGISGSMKLERWKKERGQMHIGCACSSAVFCSLCVSFLSSVSISYHCLLSSPLSQPSSLTPLSFCVLSANICFYAKNPPVNRHTYSKHINTHTHTQRLTHTHTHSGGSTSSSAGCSIWRVVFNQCLHGQQG